MNTSQSKIWIFRWILGCLLFFWMGTSPLWAATITIGSKNFTESRLLAEIMVQLIKSHLSIEVVHKQNLGGTKVLFLALNTGEIDIYPEYTGTGWAVHLKRQEQVTDPLHVYALVEYELRTRYGMRLLLPFGFSNSYALAMKEDLAERLQISRISDLKPYVEQLQVGVSHEFLNRDDGYLGIKDVYGLSFPKISGMVHSLAYQAIRDGDSDLVDAYTTDGKLLRYQLRVLQDDKELFPPYHAAPLVRQGFLQVHPDVEHLLNQLAFRLPNDRMQRLNYRVEEGESFAAVAHDFLLQENLIGSNVSNIDDRDRRKGLVAFMLDHADQTLQLTLRHLSLTLIAVALAIAFAVPLGLLLTRWEAVAGPVMHLVGVIQTIPSLALLAFLIAIPGFGLGAPSAIMALFLYALLPIVRNTYTGINSTDPALIEAARGMGLHDYQILFRVQLPLATRTIMAGIRTATVISVGVATLAAFIGAGGLGDPIITGLHLNDTKLILSGAIPAALLAILVDFVLGRLEHILAPRGAT